MVILFDRFNLSENIYEIIFATKQQEVVAELLSRFFKNNKNELTKTQMSWFATQLHEGHLIAEMDEGEYKGKKIKISYNKRQFYDRILTPMRSMGLVDYDMYRKTYKLVDKFSKELNKIGLMWGQELRKPPLGKIQSLKNQEKK